MATASKKVSKKTTTRANPSESLPPAGDVPEGFTQVSSGYGQKWDMNAKPILQGVVASEVKAVEVTTGRGKNKETKERNCVVIEEDGTGLRFTLWESAVLEPLFEQIAEHGEGLGVWIRYDGEGTKKPGQNPPKLFTVATNAASA